MRRFHAVVSHRTHYHERHRLIVTTGLSPMAGSLATSLSHKRMSPRHDPYRRSFHYRGHLLALAQPPFFLGLPRHDSGQPEAAIERHARQRPFGSHRNNSGRQTIAGARGIARRVPLNSDTLRAD